MGYFETPEIFDFFSQNLMRAVKSDFPGHPIGAATLEQDQQLRLLIKIKIAGYVPEPESSYEAGTVWQPHEKMYFEHPGGFKGEATGVFYRGVNISSRKNGASESVLCYSANTVEIVKVSDAEAGYTIEWVDNLPQDDVWPDHVKYDINEKFSETVGSRDATITLSDSNETGGFYSCLSLKVDGRHVHVLRARDRTKTGRKGRIIYIGSPSREFRDKVRICLAFAFGLPIIFLGNTEYYEDWSIKCMVADAGLSIGGAMLHMHDQPPYPLYTNYLNVVDTNVFSSIVNALFSHFDDLDFRKLSWQYWYAVAAPVHSGAVHFGGLIEQIQRLMFVKTGLSRNQVLNDPIWKPLKSKLLTIVSETVTDPDLVNLMKGKISSLNQAPAGLVLARLLESMGLSISEAEKDAWKHRNSAAHGSTGDDVKAIILNTKLLRIMVHRLVAGMSYCSDRYVDYHSLGYPTRAISEAVPS